MLRFFWSNFLAVLYAIFYVIKKHPFWAFFIFFSAPVVIAGILNPPPPPPPESAEQIAARIENQRRQAAIDAENRRQRATREAAEAQQLRYLCSLKPICEKYANVRQACAVAGDFMNCMRVKMGDDMGSTSSCRNDGSIIGASKMPDVLDCLWSKTNDFFEAPGSRSRN
jgi:hypothetical protein